MKRIRLRAQAFLSRRVGVRLVDGWREQLNAIEHKRVEQLLAATGKRLEACTLREVAQALQVSLEQALGVLAKLESVYWQPGRSARRDFGERHVGCAPAVAVTAALRELAEAVLQLPWLGHVSPHDLRFAYAGDEALPDWIRQQLTAETVPGSLPELLGRLLEADKLTAEEEARDLALHAIRERAPPGVGEALVQRWVGMFLWRHISPVGTGRTFLEIGNEFGVSRERARQACDRFDDLFADTLTATPALDRVLDEAAGVAPCGLDELDGQLRPFIGEGAGIASLLSWATLLRHRPPGRRRRGRRRPTAPAGK